VRKVRLITVLGWALLSGGCAVPEARDPNSAVMLTENYSRTLINEEISAAAYEEIGGPSWQQRPWWEYYEDAELNALVAEALAENPGINQTRARLEQAAAVAKRSLADLMPSADISGARTTSNGDNEDPSEFSLRGAAAYELDIWGGNKAAWKADNLAAEAAALDAQTAAITLSASVVENWLLLLALREEEALLQNQIETNEMVLDLQHKRYANGAAEALDVLQQKEVLERARAQLPDVQRRQELAQHQLALLIGRTPSAPPAVEKAKLPETLPLPGAGVPAELLEARPDIEAAWLRLSAADWASEAARAERLPNFDISAVYSTSSAKFKNLFDIWMLDLALGLVMPLFDGGERAAEQARQEAIADERFHDYRETVLAAIGEVEGALTRNHHQARRIEAVREQLKASRNALEQGQISYSNGNADYVSVLSSLVSTQGLEQQIVRERLEMALSRVALYRALGLRIWADKPVQMAENASE